MPLPVRVAGTRRAFRHHPSHARGRWFETSRAHVAQNAAMASVGLKSLPAAEAALPGWERCFASGLRVPRLRAAAFMAAARSFVSYSVVLGADRYEGPAKRLAKRGRVAAPRGTNPREEPHEHAHDRHRRTRPRCHRPDHPARVETARGQSFAERTTPPAVRLALWDTAAMTGRSWTRIAAVRTEGDSIESIARLGFARFTVAR
jgi:hypothetical protein